MRYRYRYDFMRVAARSARRKQQQQEGMEPRAATAQVSADFSFLIFQTQTKYIYVGVQYNRERFLTSWRSMIQTASRDKVIAVEGQIGRPFLTVVHGRAQP